MASHWCRNSLSTPNVLSTAFNYPNKPRTNPLPHPTRIWGIFYYKAAMQESPTWQWRLTRSCFVSVRLSLCLKRMGLFRGVSRLPFVSRLARAKSLIFGKTIDRCLWHSHKAFKDASTLGVKDYIFYPVFFRLNYLRRTGMERYLTWWVVLSCGLMGLVQGMPAPEETKSSSVAPTSTSASANSPTATTSPSAASQPASSTPSTYSLKRCLI